MAKHTGKIVLKHSKKEQGQIRSLKATPSDQKVFIKKMQAKIQMKIQTDRRAMVILKLFMIYKRRQTKKGGTFTKNLLLDFQAI